MAVAEALVIRWMAAPEEPCAPTEGIVHVGHGALHLTVIDQRTVLDPGLEARPQLQP